MSVIALTSASGSPGVTSTAIALALSWPRPVLLVDADPTGGSSVLAGFLRGMRPYDGGLIELAMSPLGVDEALRDIARPLDPADVKTRPESPVVDSARSMVSFVAGLRSHAQAGALRDVWEPLMDALTDLDDSGQDVIVDSGRLGLVGSPDKLLASADLTVLVTRTNLPALAAARSWAETVTKPDAGWANPMALLVGEGQPYRATEVGKVLRLPVAATVVDDPSGAAVYHRGAPPPRRFEASSYLRSIQATVASLQQQMTRGRLELVGEVTR